MKKVIFITGILIVMTICMVGCGKNDYVGKWKAVDIESAAGIHMSAEMYNELSFSFNEDNTGKCLLDGKNADFKWSETEDGLEVNQQGVKTKLVFENDKLIMTDKNSNKIYFEKQ